VAGDQPDFAVKTKPVGGGRDGEPTALVRGALVGCSNRFDRADLSWRYAQSFGNLVSVYSLAKQSQDLGLLFCSYRDH
jgi:hypothetical protein